MTSSWACFLQRFSAPWLDELMYLITNLGSEGFYIIILPILYWTWNKRAGYRVGILFLFSAYLNSALKLTFRVPRPAPTSCSRVIHPETGSGYSFPSGHAQGTAVSWGQAAVDIRRKAFWVAASAVTFLVSLSRIYLNVHWPRDVVGGLLIGAALLVLFNFLSAVWESLGLPLALRLAATLVFPLVLYLAYRGDDAYILIGFLLGLPVGRMLEERYVGWSERASPGVNILKLLTGMAVLLGIRSGLKAVLPPTAAFDIARYAAAGVWASLGAPLLFARMGWHR